MKTGKKLDVHERRGDDAVELPEEMTAALSALRARRWRVDAAAPVRTLVEAARFVKDQGLALPWPVRGLPLPDLLSAARGRRADRPDFPHWDQALDRVWDWKDRLPAAGSAFYGEAPWGGVGFITESLLPAFLRLSEAAGWGPAEATRRGLLSPLAGRVAEVLDREGPLPVMALRRAVLGTSRPRPRHGPREPGADAPWRTVPEPGTSSAAAFKRALVSLERAFIVGRFGTRQERGASWASTVYWLVDRIFPSVHARLPRSDRDARCALAAGFLRAAVWATPAQVARALGWSLPVALDALETAGVRLGDRIWTLPETAATLEARPG